ncbi:MAG: hypothetical protein ABSC94_32775 [Polyangiaceae bacterium]
MIETSPGWLEPAALDAVLAEPVGVFCPVAVVADEDVAFDVVAIDVVDIDFAVDPGVPLAVGVAVSWPEPVGVVGDVDAAPLPREPPDPDADAESVASPVAKPPRLLSEPEFSDVVEDSPGGCEPNDPHAAAKVTSTQRPEQEKRRIACSS